MKMLKSLTFKCTFIHLIFCILLCVVVSMSYIIYLFIYFNFWGTEILFVLNPSSRLLVLSTLGFKASVDPSYFVACM